jgi:hypothetical protein
MMATSLLGQVLKELIEHMKMKKRSLWNAFFVLLGLGIFCSLILSVIGSHDNERNSFERGHEQIISFNGRIMAYHGHINTHHHGLEILPILFVLFILFLVVWFVYRRFKNHQSEFIENSSLSRETPLPSSFYNKGDFLDEWEKNIDREEK